jgi:ubiquitin-protein ligase
MAHSKRLAKDIQTMVSDELLSLDIHYWYDESDMQKGECLLFGPENTPYAFCPLIFSIKMPPDYPFSSPDVRIVTSDGITRFHPNLYVNGKVCLSILGTYSGPKWASIMNIGTIFKSVYSLLNDNPITNEPGWEKYTLADEKAQNYVDWVEFNILKHTVHQYQKYLCKKMDGWNNFNDIFDSDNWKEKWLKIGEKINRLSAKGEKTYTVVPYGMSGKTNWEQLLTDYNQFVPTK